MKASCPIFLRKAKLSHYVNKVMFGNQGDPPLTITLLKWK